MNHFREFTGLRRNKVGNLKGIGRKLGDYIFFIA